MREEPAVTPAEVGRLEDRAWHLPRWGCLAVVLALTALIYACRDTILLAVAMSSAESRPELLRDAEWGKQGSARLFERQFHRGTPETSLLSWLTDNRFTIDRPGARAFRRVGSLPCSERIYVRWATDVGGRLTAATATVHEAGCI
jgi:hypothetical protein